MRANPRADYVLVRPGVLVRRGFEDAIDGWLGAAERNDENAPGAPMGPREGRGGARPLALEGGGRAWVRWNRHGGLLGGLLGDAYWSHPPRPWRELDVVAMARAAGVAAPEVLAAAAVPLRWPFHRGAVVTRAIEDHRSLGSALRGEADPAERVAWLRRAWAAIAELHRAGVHHPDLNVGNILVSRPGEPVVLIDFDRARALGRPVGGLRRALARRRFARSVAKLGLPGLDIAGVRGILRAGAT